MQPMMQGLSLRFDPGRKHALGDFDPGETGGYRDKHAAKKKLDDDIKALRRLQDVLFAGRQHGVLIVFQGMDTAGKDSAIKHVMSGVNPQGVDVHSFKEPTDEERHHDYLWRSAKVAPERGRIGIFNRSYYEEVLITRVHPRLVSQELTGSRVDGRFWTKRYREINEYERYLNENHIAVLKFYLNISKKEQAKRLLARLNQPRKRWKFSLSDLAQRRYWSTYMHVYQDMLTQTSTPWAPWYVIPADHKWFAHAAIADSIVTRMQALKLAYPRVGPEVREAMRAARRQLEK